ncbi:glycosyltransferase involved in cell wall biosynthesis [Crossiella equi]|uniref:Glycosyltransferase involved in cell wall biosynthesis n=1 Tax=Crossiella equi TaxID=130796 RepID=A0ABS5ARP6_9PSEU|nr:glycosyltransferase family 2 protein [Crossiella equi]MBP2479236.1 glycosyltransferase involved in cell wall biosynthesis [Crossiella equi]
MTRFSVVVPVRSAEDFLDECLWSVRRQTGVSLEVVVVDDASPDASGAIADRHAAADPRVTVVHLARSEGVGAARNAGIALARGEYLVFLDADDTFVDSAVLADLAAEGEPDLLLFGYEERRPCGLRRPVRPDPRAVLRASWVCWNKVYRREAVAGLRFPPGYYEDFAWSVPAVLAAERVQVSARIGVGYRRCRTSGISRGVSARHFEVFEQFERILAFLARRPELDSPEAREALADGAAAFLRSRTDRLRVVPPRLVAEFRSRSAELTARLRGGVSGSSGGSSAGPGGRRCR